MNVRIGVAELKKLRGKEESGYIENYLGRESDERTHDSMRRV